MPLRRGSETILLVEDEASLRELSCDLLEELGYTVLVVSGPEEAITKPFSLDGLARKVRAMLDA